MEEYLNYCYTGTETSEQMVEVDEHVTLRVIHFRPAEPSPYPPIVMIVGLATVIESFRDIVGELTKDFQIYYVETREKKSSVIAGPAKFDMATMAHDIVAIIKILGIDSGNYILFGYSSSASVIVEAYSQLESKPRCLLLLSPTPTFHYPSWSLGLIRFAVPLYPVLKPAAKWYLRNFVINVKEDKDMYVFSTRALDSADPRKLRDAILGIADYTIWNKLESVDCPTLIVDTSKDGIHVHEDILRMARSIKACNYIDMERNNRTHGAELGEVVRNYLNELATAM